MINVLTFDIEEWFNIDSRIDYLEWDCYEVRIHKYTELILNALTKRNQKATFFCLGWIARKYPDLLKLIKSGGHEIGCHSDTHKLITHLSINDFRRDTERAIKSLEDVIGEKILMYRAPDFSITDRNRWAFEVLIENGIEIDCSIFPASRDYGGFKSFGSKEPAIICINGNYIKEFPLNTALFMGIPYVFSGGGYFRFYPYDFISRLMNNRQYNMTYFHPHDFDGYKPSLPNLSMFRKFKAYFGQKGAFNKFERLLDEFDFVSLQEAANAIDWENKMIIRL